VANLGLCMQSPDEAAIDLKGVDWELMQDAEGGVVGAEVNNLDAYLDTLGRSGSLQAARMLCVASTGRTGAAFLAVLPVTNDALS
jgi:hypothetical protein